jgi:ABC-2 type transport system permease protein
MNWEAVRALVGKDVALYFRNRFFAVITALSLVAYTGVYFALPNSVDDLLKIALYAPGLPRLALAVVQSQGLDVDPLASEDALREAVAAGGYQAGVVLPEDFLGRLSGGEKPRVDVFFPAGASVELQDGAIVLLEELAYQLSGQPLGVELRQEVLGPDLAGTPVPPRDRMLPLFAVLLVVTEMLGLASLISEEVAGRKLQALLVTPLTTGGLFAAKGITGVTLAFGQAALFLAVTGGLGQQPLIILVALLLGAVLVTGIAFLLASLSKDLPSVMAWGVPALIILSIPAFGVLFPELVSDWVRVLPSFHLVDSVHRAANLGLGWGEVWSHLAILAGFDAAFIALGIAALKRKLT